MKHFLIFSLALLTLAPASLAANAPAILPKVFAGWDRLESKTSTDPAVADAVNAGIVKEYGFTDLESAVYTKSGRKMEIKAARFADATGAYGAFTFYKLPEMATEKFGDQGASLNERILFYRGNVLVEAKLDHVSAMSAGELRELSNAIPLPKGPARNLPTLPKYLPKKAYIRNSAKYVLGPLALSAVRSPLAADQVEFGRSPEVAIGKYSTSKGTAILILISYPTPQIAAERLRAFEALSQHPPAQQDPALAAPFTVKRTGPIVALVAGQISAGDAQSLLAPISYDADITWNQDTTVVNRFSGLLLNVFFLCAILMGLAIVAGLVFGGFRILAHRWFPGRVLDRPNSVEIIQLKLRK